MKRLFYASAAILMLSLAFHFGYATARAQAPGNPVVSLIFVGSGVATPAGFYAMTADGTMYQSNSGTANWVVFSHISGGPTPALQESWGQLKSRYAPKSGPTSQTPTDR
jgi:hypothetical protein